MLTGLDRALRDFASARQVLIAHCPGLKQKIRGDPNPKLERLVQREHSSGGSPPGLGARSPGLRAPGQGERSIAPARPSRGAHRPELALKTLLGQNSAKREKHRDEGSPVQRRPVPNKQGSSMMKRNQGAGGLIPTVRSPFGARYGLMLNCQSEHGLSPTARKQSQGRTFPAAIL